MHLVSLAVFAAVLAFAQAGQYPAAVAEYTAPAPLPPAPVYGAPAPVYSAPQPTIAYGPPPPPPPPPQPEIIEVAKRVVVRRPVVRYHTRVISEPIVEYQEEERIIKTPQVVYRPRPAPLALRYGEPPAHF